MSNARLSSYGRPIANQAVSARARFITRTYGHLFAAIVSFTLFELFLFQSGLSNQINGVFAGSPMLIFGGFLLLGMVGSRFASPDRSRTTQYLALSGYVVGEGILFVPMLTMANGYASGVIESAAVVTLFGFVGLTLVAFTTRKDFSFLGAAIRWGVMLAIVAIVASMIFGFSLGVLFSVAMVGLAGASILYSTSNVLRHHTEDSYVAASLELFASVATMFWYVLRIFMSRD